MSAAAEDPFGERARLRFRARLNVLGGDFNVETADAALLELAVEAFGGLPRHQLERRRRPQLTVRLALTDEPQTWARGSPPPRPTLVGGAGLLCATVDAGSFAVVVPAMSRALVCVSKRMLRHRYHARYELVELAFLTLATRAQALVPLHAACVGASGKGLLLMGASGAGKSTLSLHALTSGLQFLSEDSAFVAIEQLRVTGVPSYLHVSPQTLRFLPPSRLRKALERSPSIERRSGARKLEIDLRQLNAKLAATPLQLAAMVFLSKRTATRRAALRPLGRGALLARLRQEQPYAATQPGWRAFEQRVAAVPAYELRRPEHPDLAVELLRSLL